MAEKWVGSKGIFNMRFDFERSHDSYIYDKNTDREYLDFFGMFSSLPLGYNHSGMLTKEFKKDIEDISQFKVCNCKFESVHKKIFINEFSKLIPKGFDNIQFSCTGGLAVELACKTAIFHCVKNNYKMRVRK